MNLENDGERMDINYYNMNYNDFDMYQKSHYKRYEFAYLVSKNGDVIGDMACGSGYGSMILSQKAKEVNGFDIDNTTIEEIKSRYSKQENVSFKRENILDIDIENKYDKIFSFETIEHFEPNEIKKILNIFHKALKPGGYLIFSTPYNQEDSSASRKWHKTFHITENTIIEMVEGLFTIDKFYYQNYNHHDLTEDLPFKHFIICVAKKI